ncbi:restriction endonuclease subunit S [Agromyces bracchium]|uniref:Type I restriction modification DNA specificity domain-containing protein n=1 Tax=Agromyces bracchium TaxID=88376 RepID=A0A6I3M5P0_9MICO|nr:restriction endonuclease subunit S [Agromyces bracchium]MTH68664.1 hypothetical protein [Agromyces bracchium]
MSTVRLEEVALVNPRMVRGIDDDYEVAFLGMADVSEEGLTTEGTVRAYSEVRKGYTAFQDRDLLVAKITPCFENGKIAQAEIRREVGFGSTEFHVVRPKPEAVDPRYLLHFLRSPRVRVAGERQMTGSAGQKRVPAEFVRRLEVPLLPLSEQRRIAAILDEADALRAKVRAASSLLDEHAEADFETRFWDATGHHRFPEHPVNELCDLAVDCVNKTATTVDGPTDFKMLRTTNVRNRAVDVSKVRFVEEDVFAVWTRRVRPRAGDVIFTREAPAGEAAVLRTDENVFLGQRLMLYRTDESRLLPDFLVAALMSPLMQRRFAENASGSTVKHLGVPYCRTMLIPTPPVVEQRAFVSDLARTRDVARAKLLQLRQLDSLFSALQHRAFRGEL